MRYAVFHIPSATYLFRWNPKLKSFCMAIFKNKAKAGHARDDYRNHLYKTRNYDGSGLVLEHDIRTNPKATPYSLLDIMRKSVARGIIFQQEEFELISEEELNASGITLDGPDQRGKKQEPVIGQ